MGLSTVKLLTVIPDPKLTGVDPVKYVPLMVTSNVCPGAPLVGLTEVTVGGAWTTVKPPVMVSVPPGVVTDTSLAPISARASMVMLPVIWVELSTVKLLTVIPDAKLTDVAPVR